MAARRQIIGWGCGRRCYKKGGMNSRASPVSAAERRGRGFSWAFGTGMHVRAMERKMSKAEIGKEGFTWN